ncbi:lipid droplet-associated protein [Allosaccharopolyspora coralli]|uniref:Lipid droplet-associated protein n=1 Tax=Allosaccharopolyspora coralli TaxID=2665642 RepID=A0A5Q3QDF7_9PSEU|nr:lipid droplet-associated protein [Allosaccharopolyspora coralli]QGK68807.1 lipid droplet-associated protein [Allosaccharopolyspora coralli]
MRSFPFPLRVAAGLAATAVEQTRQLPSALVGLPVTVTSQALQLSMRLQQHVTELAIKGDEALSPLREPDEAPDWATFDEDEAETAAPADVPVRHERVTDDLDVLPGYDQLTLPQLRGKLRWFSEEDLTRMLDHERANLARPEFLRMLSRRLGTIRSGDQS